MGSLSQGTLSEWGLVIVGLGAMALAWAQLRSNHNQMVMQLFEKRLQIYEKTFGCILSLMHGTATTETIVALTHIAIKSCFLFGKDYVDFQSRLQRIARKLMDLEEAKAAQADRQEHITQLGHMISEHEFLCQKYMRMDQRLK